MRRMVVWTVVLGACALGAAPASKVDPVAEGFAVWQGVTAKNYVSGRELCPSDLRHKFTVVLEVEADDGLRANLMRVGASSLASVNSQIGLGWGTDWMTVEFPRGEIFVISLVGGGKNAVETFKAAVSTKGVSDEDRPKLALYANPVVAVYTGLTLAGAPGPAEKRPYVYVMGPKGKDPIWKGSFDSKTTVKSVRAAIKKEKAKLSDDESRWMPFVGSVAESKFYPQVAKTVAAGKPLAPFEKALLKDVLSKDADKANEAQILYDALCQTRSDLALRITMEAKDCPHRAIYDLQQLLRYWPAEKKRLEAVAAQLKQIPEINRLGQVYCKIMAWTDPNFTCKNAGEAKKIVGELKKMGKDLEKMKNSEVTEVQNGAALIQAMAEELAEQIPNRVPSK